MDKAVSNAFKSAMSRGEKLAPVKSIKLKVKFNTPEKHYSKKKKELAAKKPKKITSEPFGTPRV